MKKFIMFCLMAFMVGIFCEVSNATSTSTSLKNGSAVVTLADIPYADDNPTDIKDDGKEKIPKGTRLVILQYGTTISRVRVSNGCNKLFGKIVFVKTRHLKMFTTKALY